MESYVAMVCDSSGGGIFGYIPLLPGELLLENILSIYKKWDFATMVFFMWAHQFYLKGAPQTFNPRMLHGVQIDPRPFKIIYKIACKRN